MKIESLQVKECDTVTIRKPADLIPLVNEFYKNIDKSNHQEIFSLITLDNQLNVISMSIITIGTLTMSPVHPRDIFTKAISDHAAGIVVCHNHPGGDTSPSDCDIKTTKQIFAGCEILGLNLLDHIITGSDYFSFQEHDLLASFQDDKNFQNIKTFLRS